MFVRVFDRHLFHKIINTEDISSILMDRNDEDFYLISLPGETVAVDESDYQKILQFIKPIY